MADPEMTPFDVRFRSVGYLLTFMGIAFWLLAGGLIGGLICGTPIYRRGAEQPESLSVTLAVIVAALLIGWGFTRLGRKIVRSYRQGRRSGF